MERVQVNTNISYFELSSKHDLDILGILLFIC